MFIKTNFSTEIGGFIDQNYNVRDLRKAIDEKFTRFEKSLANTFKIQILSIKHIGRK